jgi:hypothetical protein
MLRPPANALDPSPAARAHRARTTSSMWSADGRLDGLDRSSFLAALAALEARGAPGLG